VLWAGIMIISFTFFACIVLYLSGVLTKFDAYEIVLLTFNFIYDAICTVMVTLAIINISNISNMLPQHIRHNKVMIWSHIVLFNLFNLIELVLVAVNWSVLLTHSQSKL